MKSQYLPLQYEMSKKGGAHRYQELLPNNRLAGLICYYWHFQSGQSSLLPAGFHIIADGCIDIVLDLMHGKAYILGFYCNSLEYCPQEPFNFFGIRFRPAAMPALFQVKANELTNQIYALEEVLSKIKWEFSSLFDYPYSADQLAGQLDHYFAAYLARNNFSVDARVLAALELIYQCKGVLQIEKDIHSGLGERQLRRLFEFYIGDSPKQLAKIVRFQNYLSSQTRSTYGLLKDDHGYYDQAHLIKEFKQLYGSTPSQVFKNHGASG
jgi:hypothetical protein